MSIPAPKRPSSPMQFIQNIYDLRRDIVTYALGSFYTNVDKIEKQHISIDNNTKEFYKHELIKGMRRVANDVFTANGYYISNEDDYKYRHKLWNIAISSCNALSQLLDEIVDIFPTNPANPIDFVDRLKTEIKLIKGVRDSDKKKLKNILLHKADKALVDIINPSLT